MKRWIVTVRIYSQPDYPAAELVREVEADLVGCVDGALFLFNERPSCIVAVFAKWEWISIRQSLTAPEVIRENN